MIEGEPARRPGEVIYHFDVERNSIPLWQFLNAARATQEIIDNFNQTLFDGKVKYELHVKTPEEGSLIEVLTIVIAVGSSVLAFLGTDIGKAFFKGLTTQEPAEWAERLGASIRHEIKKRKKLDQLTDTDLAIVEGTQESHELTETESSLLTQAEAIAVILLRFLELETDKLRAIGITPQKFRAAFQGRNKLFKSCLDNPEVQGLSFDRSPEFFLRRNDFPRLITQLPDPPFDDPEPISQWSIETVDIIVNSPNWKQDGRKWQAATSKHQDIAFAIEDERFWLFVERREIQPDIRDNMRVQWAYPAGLSKPANVRVLRVLTYNGEPISSALTDQELQAQLHTIHIVKPETPDLFDERRISKGNHSKGDGHGDDQ